MPSKKAKDKDKLETHIFETPAPSYLSQPEVQIQSTKFDGIVQLSPTFQQLNKDMECAIEDNIASPNKNIHGSINHLSMRELMNTHEEVNEQEELLVHKLKSSILVDVKGMSEEIISGIQTAAYDILQEVFTAAVPQLVRENEILKSMLTNLSEQVSTLQREIYEIKAAKAPAFSDILHQGVSLQKRNPSSTETPSNAFVINVNSDTFQPALKQIHQMEVQHLLSTPNSKLPNKEWASPEEDPDYEQDFSQSKYDENFPALPNPSQENHSKFNSDRVSKPSVAHTSIKSGWAIASSSLPAHTKPFGKKTNTPQVLHLEISGELPNFESSNKSIQFLLPILNSRLCPVLFNKCQRDLTQEDIYSLVDISAHRKVKTWLLQFTNTQFSQFIFENRRKLSSSHHPSDAPSCPKLYVNPNLCPEDKFHQIKILQAFQKLKVIGEDKKSNFSVFPQGFVIKIVFESNKFFYPFDSKKSPKEFLLSKGILKE